jgi:hypothetical protein
MCPGHDDRFPDATYFPVIICVSTVGKYCLSDRGTKRHSRLEIARASSSLLFSLSLLQDSITSPMPNSPTPNAPKNYDEIVKLLEDDTKVKVAGQFIPGLHLIDTGIDKNGTD